jgi:hypothetical protein
MYSFLFLHGVESRTHIPSVDLTRQQGAFATLNPEIQKIWVYMALIDFD